jgi:hypothetical protein
MALNAAQRQGIQNVFRQTLNDARMPPEQLGIADSQRPQLAQFAGPNMEENVRSYQAANTQFNAKREARSKNPLAREVARVEGEVEAQRRAGTPEAQLTTLRDMSYRDLEERFMKGVDGDLANQQSRERNQQALIENAMRFNIIGVITSLVKMISGGNEILNVPGQLAQQALSGRGLDPALAVQSNFLTSGLASGFMGIGQNMQDPSLQQYIGNTVASTLAPPAQPAATAQPTAVAQNAPPQPFVAPNGTLPGAPTGLPTARAQVQTTGANIG